MEGEVQGGVKLLFQYGVKPIEELPRYWFFPFNSPVTLIEQNLKHE
jgi:hypothetical protein